MARIALTLALIALSAPAHADVAEATGDVIAPAYEKLAASAAALDKAAEADCSPEALKAPYLAVWDDWARIDFLRLGPVETDGRALAMAFWPDAKASGPRAQQALIDADSPMIDDPADFAGLSVALRGLTGLERLIYPSKISGPEEVLCRLRRATAKDLAAMTADIRDEWPEHAALLTNPGGPDNSSYLTEAEARQALFTQIVTGLEYLADTRLGRPLGTFDKPRPERAESRASGRALQNVVQSLEGLRDSALALHPDAPATRAAFSRALDLAAKLDDPSLSGVSDPQGRLKVEILQQAIRAARASTEAEIGGGLGLTVGFNSKDGD